MTELHWPPDVVGRLTIGQLACLCLDAPPGEPGGFKKSVDAVLADLQRQEAEEAAWSSPSNPPK